MFKNVQSGSLKKYGFEFLSIFIAVISAFALNNWNDKRRDNYSENKILIEISNGLNKDLDDIKINMKGHQQGIEACSFFRSILLGKVPHTDSLMIHYSNLTRDFVSIQNTAGYETLKSKGLELIDNDSLRLEIIAIYEYDYTILKKFEEEYFEMQFQENYFKELNVALAPYFIFDAKGRILGIDVPIHMDENIKKELLLYLWKIQMNRNFIINYYTTIENKIMQANKNINAAL